MPIIGKAFPARSAPEAGVVAAKIGRTASAALALRKTLLMQDNNARASKFGVKTRHPRHAYKFSASATYHIYAR